MVTLVVEPKYLRVLKETRVA